MSGDSALRTHLVRLLQWHDAHTDFDGAVRDFPLRLRGVVPQGAQHSGWQIVEHIRLTQHDILDFCVNSAYRELQWPDDYWPAPVPTSASTWDDSLTAYRADREALIKLVRDPATDLFARIPHGDGQTVLREVLLVADHTAYHVGQLVLTRRLLGAWPSST